LRRKAETEPLGFVASAAAGRTFMTGAVDIGPSANRPARRAHGTPNAAESLVQWRQGLGASRH
jgi:hypothetical protein